MSTVNTEARIVVEIEGGVAWVHFENPAHVNAITPDMAADLDRALERLAADDDVKVVVIRGAGDRAFSAGADLKTGQPPTPGVRQSPSEKISSYEKPVIAMIHGVCIGGGLAIAIQADMRIAADDARFRIPVARLGVAYPFEIMSRIVELVGPSSASMLSFTSSDFDASEALRMGLVDRVVTKAELESTVRDLAREISQRAPLSVRASKMTIRAASDRRVEDEERARAMIEVCRTSADRVEGRNAFLEKREPRFSGR
jgi:enoyl-CoA hydratase/carnithine racemase